MNILEAIQTGLRKIKNFIIKTNELYDKLQEPNRFFMAMGILCTPLLILPRMHQLVWILIAVIWRMFYFWWKTLKI